MARRKRRKKRKTGNIISAREIIANLRSDFHRPTQAHENKKKRANKNACRKQGEDYDG